MGRNNQLIMPAQVQSSKLSGNCCTSLFVAFGSSNGINHKTKADLVDGIGDVVEQVYILRFEHTTQPAAWCKEFGRLYTWEGAMKACSEVEWRVPGKDEWEALIHYMGNYKFAFDFLIEGGKSGFNARLGGSYQPPVGAFANLGEVDSYWSNSFDPAGDLIWKCGFRKKEEIVWADYFPPDWYLSCRCVQDINVSR